MYNKVIYVIFIENNQISLEQERDEKFDVLMYLYSACTVYLCSCFSIV